jgi:hypothetical protein
MEVLVLDKDDRSILWRTDKPNKLATPIQVDDTFHIVSSWSYGSVLISSVRQTFLCSSNNHLYFVVRNSITLPAYPQTDVFNWHSYICMLNYINMTSNFCHSTACWTQLGKSRICFFSASPISNRLRCANFASNTKSKHSNSFFKSVTKTLYFPFTWPPSLILIEFQLLSGETQLCFQNK